MLELVLDCSSEISQMLLIGNLSNLNKLVSERDGIKTNISGSPAWIHGLSMNYDENLRSIITFLEINLHQPFPSSFFTTLRSTKMIRLTNYSNKLASAYFEDLAIGLRSMASLERLDLVHIPLSSFPDNLQRLRLQDCPMEHAEVHSFWNSLHSLSRLEDLQLSFSYNYDEMRPIISLDLSILPQYPRLRNLQIKNDESNETVNRFCATVLRTSPSFEVVRLIGVYISNDDILQTSTKSLHTFVLTNCPDIGDCIEWSNVTALLECNPKLGILQRGFNLNLPPFTYEDIDKISTSCPNLTTLEIIKSDMHPEEWCRVFGGVGLTSLRWLYSKASNVRHNEIVREITKVESDDFGELFKVDLYKFQKLKNKDLRNCRTMSLLETISVET